MGIAIACCIVAYFNWEFDVRFDANHLNAPKLYRVSSLREFDHKTTLYGHAPLPLGPVIRENMPDVQKNMRQWWSYTDFKVADNIFRANLSYVDPDFFDMFTFEFIAGSGATIHDKTKVVLSEKMALRLFGSLDVVGKMVTHLVGDKTKTLEVGGVYKEQPSNASFNSDSFMHFDNFYDEARDVKENDWKSRAVLFVQIDDPSRVSVVQKQLQSYMQNSNAIREDFKIKEFVLDPFVGMARRDEDNDHWTSTRAASPKAAVVSPIMMGVLLLLLACFNLTNTAIAMASRRLKEIGIRKVMGSVRLQIIVQFIGETLFVCFLALLVGLALGETLLDEWNSMWEGMKLTSHYLDNPGFFLFLIVVLIFTGVVAGSYPAFYISHFEPVGILKGKLTLGGTNAFTRTLLGLQYAISLLAIVYAIAFYQNSKFQRDFDLGFNANGVIIAYVVNQGEFETYRNAIRENKDIVSIAGAKHSIFSSGYNNPVKYETKQLEVDIIEVGDDYLKTMDLHLVQGRDFIKDSESDKKESVIVTEKMARDFGWDNPLGKEIVWMDTVKLYVVGVIKDVYANGMWREMGPLMIRYTSPDQYTHVVVSGPTDKLKAIQASMESSWKQIFPNRLYNGRMINEMTVEATMVNNNVVKIFAFLGTVALLLSATGLFTLVSLNIIRRMKEIGIRKILGASVPNITRIINTEFIIILSAAAVVGITVSYYLVDSFMEAIWKYYLPMSASVAAVAVGLLFLSSALTIGYKVVSTARMNPVDTLRSE